MTADHGDPQYTQEPRESDVLFPRPPIYQEEPGVRPGAGTRTTLRPCLTCGVGVLEATTLHGQPLLVEPDVRTYLLLWRQKEAHPRAYESRGYPEHQCRAPGALTSSPY
jgi:hypothetical protein